MNNSTDYHARNLRELSIDESYNTLGTFSSVQVSPLCLGTRNFSIDGGEWNDYPLLNYNDSKAIARGYMELGGNFFDTSASYSDGSSQKFLGEFFSEMQCREEVVVGCRIGGFARAKSPNLAGCGRKCISRLLKSSLLSLETNYIDILWIDYWDGLTPARELMLTLNHLVQTGAVLHLGLANFPSWFVAQCHQLAMDKGYETIVGVQQDYNLCNRIVEAEYLPMCKYTGISLMATSPLANGYLAGKRHFIKSEQDPVKIDHNLAIRENLNLVRNNLKCTHSQVAISWLLHQQNVSSVVISPISTAQLLNDVQSIDIKLSNENLSKLNCDFNGNFDHHGL
eukprot:NODE_51_length_31136_cov_0.357670.p6 type:complete len:339 gc:universal NODE_51_length_31136_cov_0.357670:28650-29666(+)